MTESGWRWDEYYEAVRSRPPRDTLLRALELFAAEEPPKAPLTAIDIGCGAGVDTLALLEQGWRVIAIDNNAEGIRRLGAAVPESCRAALTAHCARFEQVALPEADLVNASYSLPFCPPESFPILWSNITNAIRPGARFAGQLFGPKDTWAANPKMSNHSYDEFLDLLSDFEVEYLQVRDEDGTTALGDAKHWHVFSVVARKKAP